MSAKHAGVTRIADQALIDQVRACRREWTYQIMKRPLPLTQEERDDQIIAIYGLLGRAMGLLDQIEGLRR